MFYKPKGDKTADQGHAHYLQVLEGALKTFDTTDSSSSRTGPTTAKEAARQSDSSASAVFKNNFDALLKVKDDQTTAAGTLPDGNESDSEGKSDKETQQSQVLDPKEGKAKKKQFGKEKGKSKKSKESEFTVAWRQSTHIENLRSITYADDGFDDEGDDLYFMIYCFFQDFNTLREYIQERWCDYQDGVLSLSAVSVITNTAFDLLQRGEQELLSIIPSGSGLTGYSAMAEMLFIHRGLAHVDYEAQDVECGDDDDLMNEAMYHEVDFLCLPRYWDLFDWLLHIPPRQSQFNQTYREVPLNYHAENYLDKYARDRQIMYEIISGCTVIERIRTRGSFSIPGEDEFTIGILKMLANRHIPIWLILASQIQCDIQYLLEEGASNCHLQVQVMGRRVE